MAIGPDTFTNLGGAVTDLFAGLGAQTAANLKAQGIDIEALGTDISAESLRLKSAGDIAEATQYELAGTLAQQNAQYTEASTRLQATQLDRQTSMTIGSQKAAVGGAGLASSGSALDLLRSSASQGALARSVLVTQGQITEAGYTEQANSYAVMSSAARATAAGELTIAGKEDVIAAQQRQLAAETQAAGKQAAIGDFAGALMKGVAAVVGITGLPVNLTGPQNAGDAGMGGWTLTTPGL